MLRKSISLILFAFISCVAFAQTAPLKKALLIPFDPKMYVSDADPIFARESPELNEAQIVGRFRQELLFNLKIKIAASYKPFPLFQNMVNDSANDLDLVYNSIGFKFEPVENPDAKSGRKKKNEKNELKPGETAVVKGQIISKEDTRQKRTNISILNKKLIPYLREKYAADIFVFINQFEIKYLN